MASAGGRKDNPTVLTEHVDPDYEPSEKEIQDYAEWLGMDVEKDRDLFWIARQGLKAPLPESWKPCQAEDGEIFYFNFETGDSVWDHPCDEHFRQVFASHKARKENLPAASADDRCRKEKRDKKDKKDKDRKELKDVNYPVSELRMELPKPGEPLYGKPHSRLKFDCKPRQQLDPEPVSRNGGGATLYRAAERDQLEKQHQEQLKRLGEEFDTIRAAKAKELEATMVKDLERWKESMAQDLERQTRAKAEQEVEDRLKPIMQRYEQEARQRMERDIEDRLRTWADEFERVRRRTAEEGLDSKLVRELQDYERTRREELKREAEDRLKPTIAELEQEVLRKLKAAAEEKAAFARASVEETCMARLERDAMDRLRSDASASSIERAARAKLEREVEERLRLSTLSILEEEVTEKLRASCSHAIEAEALAKLKQEIHSKLQSSIGDFEREARERMESEVEDRLRLWAEGLEQKLREERTTGVELEAAAMAEKERMAALDAQHGKEIAAAELRAEQQAQVLRMKVSELEHSASEESNEVARLRLQVVEVEAVRARCSATERELQEAMAKLTVAEQEAESLRASSANMLTTIDVVELRAKSEKDRLLWTEELQSAQTSATRAQRNAEELAERLAEARAVGPVSAHALVETLKSELWCRSDATCDASLRAELTASDQRATASEQAHESLELQRSREELKHTGEKVSLAEANFEERARRLTESVEAERRQGDERLARARSEAMRLERELDEVCQQRRLDALRHGDELEYMEAQLRAAQRQVVQKEAEIADLDSGPARRARVEVTLEEVEEKRKELRAREDAQKAKKRALEEREKVLRAADEVQRHREEDFRAEIERMAQEAHQVFAAQRAPPGCAALRERPSVWEALRSPREDHDRTSDVRGVSPRPRGHSRLQPDSLKVGTAWSVPGVTAADGAFAFDAVKATLAAPGALQNDGRGLRSLLEDAAALGGVPAAIMDDDELLSVLRARRRMWRQERASLDDDYADWLQSAVGCDDRSRSISKSLETALAEVETSACGLQRSAASARRQPQSARSHSAGNTFRPRVRGVAPHGVAYDVPALTARDVLARHAAWLRGFAR